LPEGIFRPLTENELRFKLLGLAGGKLGQQIPPTGRHKRHPLPLPLDNQADRDALHPSGGEFRPHLPPQELRNFVSKQPIEDAAGFLCPDQVFVNRPGIFEGFVNGLVRDFVEDEAVDRNSRFQNLDEMPANGFPFAVFVGRQVDLVGVFEQGFELGDLLLFPGG